MNDYYGEILKTVVAGSTWAKPYLFLLGYIIVEGVDMRNLHAVGWHNDMWSPEAYQ